MTVQEISQESMLQMTERSRALPAIFCDKFLLEHFGDVARVTFGEGMLSQVQLESGIKSEQSFSPRVAIMMQMRDLAELRRVLNLVFEDLGSTEGPTNA